MSQPPLKEKFGDEQLLSTTLAIELEDVEKTLTQLRLEKPKRMLSGPFNLNVDYYFKKIFKELDNIDFRLQKLETGEQPRDWNLYKSIWKLEKISVTFNNAKLFYGTKKMIPTLIWHATFVAQPLSASLMAMVCLIAPSLMDEAQHLANQCQSLYL